MRIKLIIIIIIIIIIITRLPYLLEKVKKA